MMQDTILTLCKDSVKEFVYFMVKFIPQETQIVSTSKVVNKFEKKALVSEEESENLDDIPED